MPPTVPASMPFQGLCLSEITKRLFCSRKFRACCCFLLLLLVHHLVRLHLFTADESLRGLAANASAFNALRSDPHFQNSGLGSSCRYVAWLRFFLGSMFSWTLPHQFALTLNPSKCTVAPLGGAALLKYVAVRVRLWPGNRVM